MTRRARAILIGASTTNDAADVETAVTVVEQMAALLVHRFGTSVSLVKLVGNGATHARVTKAFESVRQEARDGELFVVLFAGHGSPASATRPFQAWALNGADRFTDLELAQALLAFEAKTDTVVISACCYGEGMFTPGPFIRLTQPAWPAAIDLRELDIHLQLRVWNQQRVAFIQGALASKNPPMVCISAAAKDEFAFESVLDDLGEEIGKSARASETYRQLAKRFEHDGFTGRAFQVDARPAARFDDKVLDPAEF